MGKFELVFIPSPGMGDLGSTLEMAKLIVDRDDRLSVTVLAIKVAKNSDEIESLSASFSHKSISFITLPQQPLPDDLSEKGPYSQVSDIMDTYLSPVGEFLFNLTDSKDSPKLAGIVIDMFCILMIDLLKDFNVPCYVFYTSNATFLSLTFRLEKLEDKNLDIRNDEVDRLKNSDSEFLSLPGFVNPIPGKIIPNVFSHKDSARWIYNNAKFYREDIAGILINTVSELESNIMDGISYELIKLPLYAVGPVLNKAAAASGSDGANILKWLDDQPPSSVVFLSMGSIDEDQVKEIASALEKSAVRFLWSLPNHPANVEEGFLDRTVDIGKVIGSATQMEVLAHPATGGFISDCGWNSILQSICHGVPVATWPMDDEQQQLNAFEMVVELGLAVEITLNYVKGRIVSSEEIERGIKELMNEGNKIRKKVKAKSEEIRAHVAAAESGSFVTLGYFIDDVLAKLKSSTS